MNPSRREFLMQSAAGLSALAALPSIGYAAESAPKIRIAACDWSLHATDPNGLDVAKQIGLDGLEISAGLQDNVVAISDAALRQQYKEKAQATGLAIPSVAMGFLNSNPFATEPDASAWLDQTIDAAADLGAKIILLAFFGKGDLRDEDRLKQIEVDAAVERIKAAAPRAEKAGVILGIENTLSGKDNLAILDRVQSSAVQIYYDTGNSTNNGYDVPAEIRDLGKSICQIHFKDGANYLGEGDVNMPPIGEAIKAIEYEGWIVLETSAPSHEREADFRRNAEYVRTLMGIA